MTYAIFALVYLWGIIKSAEMTRDDNLPPRTDAFTALFWPIIGGLLVYAAVRSLITGRAR